MNVKAVAVFSAGLFVLSPRLAFAEVGFAPGQTMDPKAALAEARRLAVPEVPSRAAAASSSAPSPEWGREFPVSEIAAYAAVRCKEGVGVAAASAGEDRRFLKIASAPFFPGGTVLTGVKYSIDKDFILCLRGGNGCIGRLSFQSACAPWHADREIHAYVPVALNPATSARLAVRLDGGCRSTSNWPNDPGRTYWRDTRLTLSVYGPAGAEHRLEQRSNWVFPDQASCEAGRFAGDASP